MTNKQKELLELIKKQRKHLTAEEIFLLAKNNNMNISLASIYRILNTFVEEKQLRKISNIYKQEAYDVWIDDHEHLVCSKCGKVSDIKIKNFKNILSKYINVDIDDYDLCVRYICDDCKKEENK